MNWEHWLPWTPAANQATFEISLSCTDGRPLGQFREAFEPAAGAPMPAGNAGLPGSTSLPCTDWPRAYFSRRQAAGLPATPSQSIDSLDLRLTIHPDGSADVLQTQRVLFTDGRFSSLSWPLGPAAEAQRIFGLVASVDGVAYPLNPKRPASPVARTRIQNGQSVLDWSFAPVDSPAAHVFVRRYHLANAVQQRASGSRLERLALPASRFGPAWHTTVEVILPERYPPADVRLSSIGAPTRAGLADSRTASFAAQDVPVGTALDVTVDFPSLPAPGGSAGSPTPTASATAAARLRRLATSAAPTPTPALSPTPTRESTETPTPTPSPTVAVTSSVTATATSTPTLLAASRPTAAATPIRRACRPVPILAMYYDWYDLHTWTSGKTSDQPVTPDVSADRSTIERRVSEAQSAGSNGFEVNWWGPGNQTDTNQQTLLAVAGGHGFTVTADCDLNSPFVHSAGDVTNALIYLKRYFSDPSWFHYQGRPFVLFYGTRRYDLATWGAILHQVDPNHAVFWMAEGDIFSYLTDVDGIHPSSIAWSPDPSNQLAIYASRTRAYPGKAWMATVMPGYNDVLARGTSGFSVDRQNGAYYSMVWHGAMATSPDILSITSFNEWVEGSQIEPSTSCGNLYLDLTKRLTDRYHARLRCG